jgi:hypothetical protein
LDLLPATLRAYGRSLNPEVDRVLVLIDVDGDDCQALKARLLAIQGATTPWPFVLFSLAIEEAEAFYLGDIEAIRKAFPAAMPRKMKDYVQDSICGTWEVFRDVIGADSENKPEWARRIAPHLGIEWKGADANLSASFCYLCRALLTLAGKPLG